MNSDNVQNGFLLWQHTDMEVNMESCCNSKKNAHFFALPDRLEHFRTEKT